jgi:type IV pilus assembly protein PilM
MTGARLARMLSRAKSKAVVGLDLEAGSVAAAEVTTNGSTTVARHGVVPLGSGVFREGEVTDPAALAEALKGLFAEHKLSKTVRLGIANQKVAVRTLRLPVIEDNNELETAIRFQAQDHIPMPLDQAVLDWQVVNRATGPNGERLMDVVAVAARRDMLGRLVDAMRTAGLRPVGIDLSAFGMIRALAREAHAGVGASTYVDAPTATDQEEHLPRQLGGEGAAEAAGSAEAPVPARLYCNLGDVTNLAVARGTACLFTRVSPYGVEGISQKLAERRQLTLEHARQWLGHVGLERPVESIDGEADVVSAAREALAEGASRLVDEMRLSLEFYAAQEDAVAIEGVVACGPGTTIPGLVDRLQRDLGQPFSVARPQALAHIDDSVAARLTLPYGLALQE